MAWRQLKVKVLPMISMVILCIYVLLALMDSIAWHDRALNPDGSPSVNVGNYPVFDTNSLTLLDRAFSSLRKNNEKTFSAPFAGEQFTMETIVKANGAKQRITPKLKYPGAHWLGTDKVGSDVLFAALKGVRTALIVGGLTTLIVIPFAIFFGVMAGFFGKWIDDIIQYSYTTLASIPNVLLIVSFMLLMDKGLFQLCIILGVTNWTGLCRFLRGETLKLRELDYVQAAEALGVSRLKIIYRHIVPNLMHIVLIACVLRFSAMVLTEAVLSYIGIGVGSNTGSWGTMINAARLDLTREPVVWWNLLAAFVFMIGLILPANIFGDALRDALDPKLKTR
ncbi:MAG: ABC transporter permease [Planctomycetes bacterium]|nr:ABC transporter permease [Planctomycetota bacterium]